MSRRVHGLVPALALVSACGASVAPLRGSGVDVVTPTADVPQAADGSLPPTDASAPPDVVPIVASQLDLLLEIDNSNSMEQNQANLSNQLATLIEALVSPPDANGDGVPDYPAVQSLHVGVIDQDLGTPGSTVPGCVNSDAGDDALLNPIRYGQAEQRHLPDSDRPSGFRPADCSATQFPSFIGFDSGATDLMRFAHDVQCNADLRINGCGLEQQLEAVWRALIWHHADDSAGNTDPNAGFLRSGALLAIVMLTDEDDLSVVDCRYWTGAPGMCPDPNALDVYDAASNAWSSPDLNLRTYLYQPCSAQDPTWSLARYIDPGNPAVGFPGLKPGHPEAVVFAAITGVPLAGDGFPFAPDGSTDWDALLGDRAADGADDFCGRNASESGRAVDLESAEGHVSMRQANADPACPTVRTVPACRRAGTSPGTGTDVCSATSQYYAYPARRIVEVARRFDQSAFCSGSPLCHNGVVTSVCSTDYSSIVQAITRRLPAP